MGRTVGGLIEGLAKGRRGRKYPSCLYFGGQGDGRIMSHTTVMGTHTRRLYDGGGGRGGGRYKQGNGGEFCLLCMFLYCRLKTRTLGAVLLVVVSSSVCLP